MVSLELEARLDNLLSTAQAETANTDLFAPLMEREECPICMIPLPIDEIEIVFQTCCGKSICCGCIHKQKMNDNNKCAFCCQPVPKNIIKALKKLTKRNNVDALIQMVYLYNSGEEVFQSDTKSLEMRIRAAELGSAKAFSVIGKSYIEGTAVEVDRSRSLAFYEIAAKKGCIIAHQYLAAFNFENGDYQRCTDHLKVCANAGCQGSMNKLMAYYKTNVSKDGLTQMQTLLTKEDLAQTLRAFQSSNNEMKSKDRDDARAARASSHM